VIRLVGDMPVQGTVGAACAGVRRREAAAQLGCKEGLPGLFVVVVVFVIVVNPWTAQASMSMATGGMGGGGGAANVASCVPLLSDGKLLYGSGDDIVVVVPSLQILPQGARAIAESHLAEIDGHQRHRSSATTITSTTANASAASLSSNALALLNSLEEATGDEDATVIAVKSHAPLLQGCRWLHSLSLIRSNFFKLQLTSYGRS
jgi:hypothetical protein